MASKYKLVKFDRKLGLKEALGKLELLVSGASLDRCDSQLIRFEIAVCDIDILRFFAAQHTKIKMLWFSRDDGFKVAGFGTAFSLRDELCKNELAFQSLGKLLSCLGPEVQFFGGMRFDEGGRLDDAWSKFGGFRFVLPQIELKQVSDCLSLCVNCWSGNEKAKILAEIRSLMKNRFFYRGLDVSKKTFMENDLLRVSCEGISELPGVDRWKKNICESLRKIENGSLKKVVLARRKTMKFSHYIDPDDLLVNLQTRSQSAYLFYFRNEFGDTYLGASPEKLYSRRNNMVESEAIAGTRERGKNEEKDRRLESELLHSQKDQLEQNLVCSEIEKKFATLCCDFGIVDKRKIIKLPNVQHLCTRFRGILRRDVRDFDIVQALHPTSAVCGLPSEKAFSFIKECEPFDRGCYAGPVGYIGKDHAEFAVGIRSALISGKNLHLFAGAGVVKGSVAKDEWDEIENKMKLFGQLFETSRC